MAAEAIVVTGCGWVTPFAVGSSAEVIRAGRDAGMVAAGDEPYRGIPDAFLEKSPDLPKEMQMEKGAWVAGLALEQACRQAGLDLNAIQGERSGIVVGSALAGQGGMIAFAQEVRDQSPRFVSPIHFPQTVGNYVAGALTRAYHLRGPNETLSCGTASGLDALVEAGEFLASGAADVVIAGGTDTFTEPLSGTLRGEGLPLSEGACLFVLERGESAAQRGAVPLATLRRSFRLSAKDRMPEETRGALFTCAGCCYPGGIFIEHWIGKCQAAAGAATLAAAIGAAAGLEVPFVDTSRPDAVTVRRIQPESGVAGAGELTVYAVADADNAHRTAIEAVIPRPS